MKGFCERIVASKCSSKTATDSPNRSLTPDSSEPGSSNTKLSKNSLWPSFFASAFSVFDTFHEYSHTEKTTVHTRINVWTSSVKKIMAAGTMRRIHERVLGPGKIGIPRNSDIWLLGVCYKISQANISRDASPGNELTEFMSDFSSRIWVTYRKGFDAIEDSKLTSDVGWGCMLRSSQMLIAQALLFHRFGRSWRNPLHKPMDQVYVEILHLFGDSVEAMFSIHNLLRAGKAYGLAAGSWAGPYATCHSWESLARSKSNETNVGSNLLPMAVYVVSGDEDGERGGAPVLCIEDASKHCFEFSKGQADWTPILLLVPLVLGLDKINPRYVPSLQATFTFPQSLGILGGKSGSSTYIVGVQDEYAFYLDPHEIQTVVNIGRDDVEADTSSYHCNVTRYILLELIDPSLAIGFYCRDKADFEEFCLRASKLADESNGAPLFTVANSLKSWKPVNDMRSGGGEVREDHSLGALPMSDADSGGHEDDWQLL